jgi:hypothetical protein
MKNFLNPNKYYIFSIWANQIAGFKLKISLKEKFIIIKFN